MQGVTTHVSDPKSSTACTTALKNIPNYLGFAPYLTKILDRHAHIFFDISRFPTTAGQLLSEAIIIRPKHLKYVADSSGLA